MTARTSHGLKFWSIVLSAAAVVAGRHAVPGHGLSPAGSYEAFAHLWAGFLFAVVLLGRHTGLRWTAGAMLAAASGYELMMFLLREK